MVKPKIIIGHLYPKQMNVYGDMGNVITLTYRLEQRGFDVSYKPIDSVSELQKAKVDILVGGGGQDSNQDVVQLDLTRNKQLLKQLAEDGMPMLMICGLYQLFGHRFIVSESHVIEGIGVLDIETKAGDTRLIGNVVAKSSFGVLVGFENHSGRTFLSDGASPLATVVKGAGNNGETRDEGAIYNNVFGSYLHGPCLAKNPQFADEIIKRSFSQKGLSTELTAIDDSIEKRAAALAMRRPR